MWEERISEGWTPATHDLKKDYYKYKIVLSDNALIPRWRMIKCLPLPGSRLQEYEKPDLSRRSLAFSEMKDFPSEFHHQEVENRVWESWPVQKSTSSLRDEGFSDECHQQEVDYKSVRKLTCPELEFLKS
jgi:hypothetical protein